MPYLKHDDLNLYFEVHGEGTPIVFLHPPVMGHLTFRFQRPLEEQVQLIFVDLIGSGRSTKRSRIASIADLAKLVYRLIDKLKLKKVILCGYSSGGSIAQEFALLYPERTAGLILIGGFPEVSSYFLKKEFELGIWASKKGLGNLFSFVLPFAHFDSSKNRNDMASFISRMDGETISNMYEISMDYVSTDRIGSLHVPLLLMYGQSDLYMRSYFLPFCENVKDVEIVLISDVAHQALTRRPDECNHIIMNWIKRKKLDR